MRVKLESTVRWQCRLKLDASSQIDLAFRLPAGLSFPPPPHTHTSPHWLDVTPQSRLSDWSDVTAATKSQVLYVPYWPDVTESQVCVLLVSCIISKFAIFVFHDRFFFFSGIRLVILLLRWDLFRMVKLCNLFEASF